MKKRALISCACVIMLALAGCETNPPLPKPASSDMSASSAQATASPINDYKGEHHINN